MIIAAYAGCGKTTFANTHSDVCVEIASMPYARILPVVEKKSQQSLNEKSRPNTMLIFCKEIMTEM